MNTRTCYVEIPEGREYYENGAKYVKIPNGNFSIKLRTFVTPEIAKVFFQGVEQGQFVLEPGVDYEAIERSVFNQRRFAVYDSETPEASLMGKDSYTEDEKGLIEVRFYEAIRKRELQPLIEYGEPSIRSITYEYSNPKIGGAGRRGGMSGNVTFSNCFSSNSAVIGTEGKSYQSFRKNDHYIIDHSKEPICLLLRLIPERRREIEPLERPSGYVSPYPRALR